MKIAIIIPAYNEEKVIGKVIRNIPRRVYDISNIETIVVDDKSTDETWKVAKTAGATVLRHRINLGAGGATMTGLEYARRHNFDIAVTMDADGQHDPRDISRLVRKVMKGYDFVIGSRLKEIIPGEMPFHRLVGNKFFNFVTFLFYGTWVTDSQSGFKALSKRAIGKCRIQNVGYEFCSEMIGLARANKLKICEEPIRVIYSDYSKKKGQHYLNGFNIILRLTINKITRS